MKTCIWCRGQEPYFTFNKKAHTFPQSLGGTCICENVCDNCNKYFGSPTREGSSVEVFLKEALNISKYMLLTVTNDKPEKRYKSELFDVNWEKQIVKPKFKYKYNSTFQEFAGRQLRRGFYKVFLEERERQRGDALDERFNFIREFARYNLNNPPIFFTKSKFDAVIFQSDDVKNPQIRFTEHSDFLDKNYRMYEYLIIGHNIVIPTSSLFVVTLDRYLHYLRKEDLVFGTDLIEIKKFKDLNIEFKNQDLFINESK